MGTEEKGFYEKVSGKIRFYMEQSKVSEKELAKRTGLGDKKIRQWLNADFAQLGVEDIEKIAIVLGISPEFLLNIKETTDEEKRLF
nr:helix-turn-helix transcriptional regulator [Eubacterium sp.]